MSKLNPYEGFLDGRPLEVILAETSDKIAAQIKAMGADKLTKEPAPGKWSATEIIAHLAETEVVFAVRLRQTLAEDAPTIQPFDQDKWATTFSGISAQQALEVFAPLRSWNLMLIAAALPQSASRPVIHPERGTMTFLTLVETMAGHDINHLAQLQRLAIA